MRQALALLLTALVTLESSLLPAQTEKTYVLVAAETCKIGNLSVPCSDVGAKLRELGTPLDADIHLRADPKAKYEAVSAAIASLRDAGFKLKMGYINVQPQ